MTRLQKTFSTVCVCVRAHTCAQAYMYINLYILNIFILYIYTCMYINVSVII